MVASSNIAITPLSRWVSLLFNALRTLALTLWTETQHAAGIVNQMVVPPWLILSADTLFDKLQSASVSCTANSRQPGTAACATWDWPAAAGIGMQPAAGPWLCWLFLRLPSSSAIAC